MKRKKGFIGFIFGGIIFIIVGIGLLWWNEGRSVNTSESILEFSKVYEEIDSKEVNKKNNNKAVYTKGSLLFDEAGAFDEEFDLNIKTPVIERTVEMYQWEENCSSDDVGETCSYDGTWSEDLIDSSNFESKHTNPTTKPFESERFYASNIKLDEFDISDFNDELPANKKYTSLDEKVAKNHKLSIKDNYYTNALKKEKVGNIRISFKYNDAKNISILGLQKDDKLTAYIAKNGYKVSRVENGIVSAEDMIRHLNDDNNLFTWIFRIVGAIIIIAGFVDLIFPLQSIAKFVPILGNVFNFVTTIIGILFGLCISLLVIAIAWFRFRPLLSIAIIITILCILMIIKLLTKKTKVEEINE